jgi:hypothetical protein
MCLFYMKIEVIPLVTQFKTDASRGSTPFEWGCLTVHVESGSNGYETDDIDRQKMHDNWKNSQLLFFSNSKNEYMVCFSLFLKNVLFTILPQQRLRE